MNSPGSTATFRLNVMTAIAALGCVVSIVGVLLPWGTVTIPIPAAWESSTLEGEPGELSIPGTDTGDGKIILGLAFAALAVIVAFRLTPRRWLAVVALLLGAVIAITGIADTVKADNIAPERVQELLPTYFSVGAGLYVVILGGLALTAAAAYLALTTRRTPPPERTTRPRPPHRR